MRSGQESYDSVQLCSFIQTEVYERITRTALWSNGDSIGLTLKCQLKEVPLLSHRPTPTTTPTTPTTTITSQFRIFGGKFKCEMQIAKCEM